MWADAVAWVRAHQSEAQRLSGGFNNEVFAVDGAVIKLYRVDERRRWEREWRALTFLAERGLDLAAQPLWYDPAGDPPAIVMERLPGEPLHERPVPILALAEHVAALHSLPGVAEYPLTVNGTPTWFAEHVLRTAARLSGLTHDELAARSLEPLRTWLASPDRDILKEDAPIVFSRGDANLANCLWDGTRVRSVDLEYAGRSDAAFDLADLVEHVTAHRMSDGEWAPLLARFDCDRSRFEAARRLAANFWLTILWRPEQGRPVARIEAQLARIKGLC